MKHIFASSTLRRCLAFLLATALGACQSQTASDITPDANSETSTLEDVAIVDVDEEVLNQVFPDDFAQVCSGIAFQRAKSYEPIADAVHHLYVFHREDDSKSFSKSYRDMPEGWELPFEDSQDAQLVACLTITNQELANTCEFPPEEGETETYTLETYSTAYDVEIYAAQSGELLDNATLELQGADCPMFHMFTEGEPVDTSDADYTQALLEFVKPYVQPDA